MSWIRKEKLMKYSVVILTKSDMKNGYCVAGIDVNTGKWIRFKDKTKGAEGPLFEEDLKYADGKEVKILDVVDVECLDEKPNVLFQPENVYINKSVPFVKIKEMSWGEIINKWNLAKPEINLLGINGGLDCISAKYVNCRSQQKSLQMLKIQNVKVAPNFPNNHPKINFDYVSESGKILNYEITLTDPENCLAKTVQYDNAFLIVSLGTEFANNHYLLGAKLITDASECYWVTSSKYGTYYHSSDKCSFLTQYNFNPRMLTKTEIEERKISKCTRCEW